ACARHPHISFNFCRTARTAEEYAGLLRRYAEIEIRKSDMRRESLVFYYMHNLNVKEDEKALLALLSALRKSSSEPASEEPLAAILRDMDASPAYREHVSRWLGYVT